MFSRAPPSDECSHPTDGICSKCSINAGTEPSQPAELHDAQKEFVRRLIKIGRRLREMPTREEKSKQLMFDLYLLNHQLPARIWLPIYKKPHIVLRVPFTAGCVLNSKDKAPYCIYLEVLDVDSIEHAVLPPKGLDPELSNGRNAGRRSLASTSAPANLDAVCEPPAEENTTDSSIDDKFVGLSTVSSPFTTRSEAAQRSTEGNSIKTEEETERFGCPYEELPFSSSSSGDIVSERHITPTAAGEKDSSDGQSSTSRSFVETRPTLVVSADASLATSASSARSMVGLTDDKNGEEEAEEKETSYTSFAAPSTSSYGQPPHSSADMLDLNNMYSDELPDWFRMFCPGSQRRRRQQIEHSAEDPSASTMSEPWEEKVKRMRDVSPYGHLPNWRLKAVIVKTGDDLNHEKLVYKFLVTLKEIWQEEHIKLYLRPYQIFVLSNDSGLIEPIPNACSLHQIMWNMAYKPRYDDAGQRYAPTLLNHFFSSYGSRFAPKFLTAQKNFLRSCAAYCLVCYFLQVKDRHNGNILLDHDGHLIHIDFGFILSQSPGNLNFESSPFKLTNDLLEVMNGPHSELFIYFKWLMKQGLLAARKHHKRLIAAVEKLVTKESFGPNALKLLEDRFSVNNGDEDVVTKHIESMVYQSRDSFTTRLYDNFQYLTNGIR